MPLTETRGTIMRFGYMVALNIVSIQGFIRSACVPCPMVNAQLLEEKGA